MSAGVGVGSEAVAAASAVPVGWSVPVAGSVPVGSTTGIAGEQAAAQVARSAVSRLIAIRYTCRR
jgi:hypothetical protein